MSDIVRTKSYVVMTTFAADEILASRFRYGRLARQLSERLEEEHRLLQLALHELATVQGLREHERFVRHWLHEHRKLDLEGVPIERPE